MLHHRSRPLAWGAARVVAVVLLASTGMLEPIHAQSAGNGRASTDLFDEVFEKGRGIDASLRTVTARFTETTTSSLLTRPLVAHGVVAVERPARVVLQYSEPEQRIVLIDGDRLTVSWPGRNIRQVRDIGASQRRVQRYFVGASADELRKEFDILAEDAPDRAATYRVTMRPKRRQIREGIERLELWIGRSTLLMSAMRMTFPNGDTKLMTFEDVSPNAEIDPGLFRAP
jgi:outer membrane lipoprotein-sorting protein